MENFALKSWTHRLEAKMDTTAISPLPVLCYASACRLCRFLSAAIVLMSLGLIRRIPMELPAVRALYQENPHFGNRPILVHDRGIAMAFEVFRAVPAVVVRRLVGRWLWS